MSHATARTQTVSALALTDLLAGSQANGPALERMKALIDGASPDEARSLRRWLFEGRGAAGKGGAIKRFMGHLNPRGARVVALKKPSDVEKGQW